MILIAFLYLTFAALIRKMEGRKAVDSAGARFIAWLAAALSVAALAVFGAAFAVTGKASEILLIFGLVSWAKYGAWLGLLAGLCGLLTLSVAVRAHRDHPLPVGSLLGFLLTGLAAVGLSAFLLFWGLGP